MTLLTNAFSRRRTLTLLVTAGCFVDFSLGVFLNAHVQSLEENAPKPVFGGLEISETALQRAVPLSDALTDFAWINWFGKHRLALCDQWLVQLPERNKSNPAFESASLLARAQIVKMRQEDGRLPTYQ